MAPEPAGMANSVMAPLRVILPSRSVYLRVNPSEPFGAAVSQVMSFPFVPGTWYRLVTPLASIRRIDLLCANHSLPSGPLAIPKGRPVPVGVYSVTQPAEHGVLPPAANAAV